MADVSKHASLGQQVALIAGLRWRIFRNSLRSTSAKLDLVAFVLTVMLTGVAVFGIGIAIAAGAYYITAGGRVDRLALLLWVIFLAWHLLPVMIAASTARFDFRNLLRFPMRFTVFFLLSLAYGLFDPAALAAVFWLACLATGLALARPDLLPWALLVLGVFAGMNLLLSRMIHVWLERLLARRRTREALWAIVLLGILSLQFSGMFIERWGQRAAPLAARIAPVLRVFPPELSGWALAGAAKGDPGIALVAVVLVGAYGLACGILLQRRLLAQYRGEDLGESRAPQNLARAPATPIAAASPSAGFAPRFFSEPVAAIMAKEARYIYRNTVVLLALAMPIIMVVFLLPVWRASRGHAPHPPLFQHMPDLAFPGALAYMFLILVQQAHNIFGYEGRGIQFLFLAPVRFRDVLLAKNLLSCAILAIETAAVGIAVSVLERPPRLIILVSTLSGLLFATLIHLSVGNWLSLQFPRRLEMGAFRQRAAGMTVLVGFVLHIVLGALIAMVVLLARLLGNPRLVPVAFALLSGAAFLAYRALLDPLGRFALTRREALTSQLCR